MYCKRLKMPPLPKDITDELIEYATRKLECAEEFKESYNDDDKDGAKVSFYPVPPALYDRIQKLLYQYPETKGHRHFFIQLVHSGVNVPLHIDAVDQRSVGINYMLKTGGDNIATKWWEIKEEFKDEKLPDAVPLDAKMFTEVESHVLKESCWYEMTFSQVHSAEGMESLRLALAVMFHDCRPRENV